MPRSESESPEPRFDWRGWLALAWVVYFGILYGKMVIERRGDKIRDAIHARP